MNQFNAESESEFTAENNLSGQTLGDYLLLRRLGRGGMADVYLARQTSLDRNVALKVLKPDLAEDNSYVKRFHREAQSAAALVQANIVQIYEVTKLDGYHCIAQEYVQGRNLRQYLERYGAVEPVMALTVLRQCSLALQKAGEFKVIHRDIKPENIMLSTSGEVKVTDFGLARVNNDATQQTLTQIGVTMGTTVVHEPRTSRREIARFAQRYLFTGRDRLPDACRASSISRGQSADDCGSTSQKRSTCVTGFTT